MNLSGKASGWLEAVFSYPNAHAPFERQDLSKTLSSLPTAQFEHVVFSIKVPGGIVPSSTAPQGERAAALLVWAETTGPGLNKLQAVLAQVLEKELPDLPDIRPYKGLSYFDCNDEDHKYFYGREVKWPPQTGQGAKL